MPDCRPVAIASYEKMIDPITGPVEVARFIAAIEGKTGLVVIEEEARPCVWEELIVHGKGGVNTYQTREGHGPEEDEFQFTAGQMEKIQDELYRLRDKYSSVEWAGNELAETLLTYLNEYIEENQNEIASTSSPK